MKKLIALRHGNSPFAPDDFNRGLSDYGVSQAKDAAKKIDSENISIDLVLHSAALRTTKTAHVVADELSIKEDIIIPNHELYNATLDEIISVLREQDDSFNTILLVGHNPGLSELCSKLSVNKFFNLETAEFKIIDLNHSSWNSIS